MPPRRYYFRSTDGDTLGPVSLNVVAEMIQADRVKANTPISIDGTEFKPMKSFPELATLLSVDLDTDIPDEDLDADLMEAAPDYSGSLQEVSFPKLLYHFIASKVTGRLVMNNQSVKKEVYLVNGKAVAATSNLERDHLGQHLVRSGALTEQKLQHYLAETSHADDRLGDFLLQHGVLNPHDLVHHLKEQLLQKIYEIFNWRVGSYAFYAGQQYKGSLLPMNMNPWELVTEGVRQGYEIIELKELLAPFMSRVLIHRTNENVHLNQLGLHPRELKLFKMASGQRSLGGLIEHLGDNEKDRRKVLTMVYMGLELELLSLGDEAIEDDEPLPGDLDAAVSWDQAMTQPSDEFPEEDFPEADQGPFLATPPISRAEQSMLETLNTLKTQDHFERLGLERNASTAEVSNAFLTAARKYHPDNIPPDAPEKVRELTSDIFTLLNEAQQKLGDDQFRADYVAALESGHEDEEVDVGNIMEAESAFQKGEVLLNARKYTQALEEFETALELNPDEGEFLIYRGYARFMANPDAEDMVRRQCIETILKGLKMRDNNVANGYLFIGRIGAMGGDDDKARKMFKKALTIDNKHTEATRELRLLNMRKEKTKKPFWRKK